MEQRTLYKTCEPLGPIQPTQTQRETAPPPQMEIRQSPVMATRQCHNEWTEAEGITGFELKSMHSQGR